MGYIDVNKLKEELTKSKTKIYYLAKDVTDELDAFPTEDVVSKIEYDNMQKIAEKQQSLAMDRYFQIQRLTEKLEKAKQEVASNIF